MKKILEALDYIKKECSKSNHCCNCKFFDVRKGCHFRSIPKYWERLEEAVEKLEEKDE